MVNVSHIVEKIIISRPFIQECLARGIINQAALAEEIIPAVEKELDKEVKFSAVNMAIRRLSEKLDKKLQLKIEFDKNSDIIARSDLFEVNVHRIQESEKNIKKISEIVQEGHLTITQGINEIMIIASRKYYSKIMRLFTKKEIKKVIKNLASVTINLPEASLNTVGLFYLVTRGLQWENTNIIDIVSTYTEMTYIVREEDASKVFDTFKKLIHKEF